MKMLENFVAWLPLQIFVIPLISWHHSNSIVPVVDYSVLWKLNLFFSTTSKPFFSYFVFVVLSLLLLTYMCLRMYRCSQIPGVLSLDPAWSEDCVWRGHSCRPLPSARQGQEEALLAAVNGTTELNTEEEEEERLDVWEKRETKLTRSLNEHIK